MLFRARARAKEAAEKEKEEQATSSGLVRTDGPPSVEERDSHLDNSPEQPPTTAAAISPTASSDNLAVKREGCSCHG